MNVPQTENRGLILIIVVGVLGITAVLAAAFVTMAQLERKASRQRVNAAKAWLLARSGIEDAQARLALGQDAAYKGEDWNGNGALDTTGAAAIEKTSEVYRPGVLDTDDCPARDALRPSFFVAQASGLPATVPVDGRQRGLSGRLTADYGRPNGQSGNQYAIKVSSSGGFYLNGGDPGMSSDPTQTSDANTNLQRMLGILAEAVDTNPNGTRRNILGRADGENLVALRPAPGGWQSLSQVRDMALGGSQAKLDAIRNYLTLHAWVDPRVIAPTATTDMIDNKRFHSWGDIKLAHGGPPRFEPRAPVDLSWARSRRPALIALLANLKGLYLDEYARTPQNPPVVGASHDSVGAPRAVEITLDWAQPSDDCRNTADAVLASTSPLGTWQDWNAFCDALPMTGTSDAPQAKRDVLKANFNPNSDLNKFNPNRSLWKSVDKSDLLVHSTELSLVPLQGLDIESVGRVLDRNGRLLAQRVLRASLAAPSAARLTTQKDFVCGDGPRRLPGDPDFLSFSQGVDRTWGADQGKGVAIQSYPEPCYDLGLGAGLQMNPADYDGNLQLATVETAASDVYGVVNTVVSDMKLLAHFGSAFDLDVAKAYPANPKGRLCVVDQSMVWTTELGNSLLDRTKPNTLYPDGAYSERDRAPAFYDKGNANGFHGVMSFWIKPNYTYNSALEGAALERSHQYVKWTNTKETQTSTAYWSVNQFFFLGDVDVPPPGDVYAAPMSGYFADFEICTIPTDDKDTAHRFLAPLAASASTPHRWRLLTLGWDFKKPTLANKTGELRVDDGTLAGSKDVDPSSVGVNKGIYAQDITADDLFGPHTLILGRRGFLREFDVESHCAQGSDATFDEFAIYDFGDVGNTNALNAPATMAKNRYSEGRYYKGAVYRAVDDVFSGIVNDEAASYLTNPIHPPPGSVLREVDWTWYKSSDPALAQDYARIELVTPSANAYLWGAAQSGSFPADPTQRVGDPTRQSWMVNRAVPGDFRARVVFLRPPVSKGGPDLSNTPILDSPVFDDLTFVYGPAEGTGIVGWEELP